MLAHGLVDRETLDVDMFTPDADISALATAVIDALRRDGLSVVVETAGPTYVRLTVEEPAGRACKVELARDARIRPPVTLDVGPVLDVEEVAADKVLALFGRAAARDFVDVVALRRRFAPERLLDLAAEKDPGFDVGHFVRALRSLSRYEDDDFTALGVSARDIAALREAVDGWARELDA